MLTRRSVVKGSVASCAALGFSIPALGNVPADGQIIKRVLPNGKELIPVVGIGTSRVFDVSRAKEALDPLTAVLRALFLAGGSVIDTAHNYHRSEAVVGHLLDKVDGGNRAFLSTKVYAVDKREGQKQIVQSFNRLRRSKIDLLHVHNMVGAQTQYASLSRLKDEGRIRYIGLSHFSDEGIDEIGRFISNNPVDFIQFRYSIDHRYAEKKILQLAQEKGVAVQINQPFSKGALFKKVRGRELPLLAEELGCKSWAQFFLKFIISHPAVHCVIPGTGKLKHAVDNIGAGMGYIPSADERLEMSRYWNTL